MEVLIAALAMNPVNLGVVAAVRDILAVAHGSL
jgi:hypothetical protein